jgi:hypothetical protein
VYQDPQRLAFKRFGGYGSGFRVYEGEDKTKCPVL